MDWYCPNGIDGIHPSRVILLDGDTMLGESVALMHTPGHTEGNHSFVAHTPEGLMVTSENGVAPDSYAPRASRIPGVARYAEQTGMEVILNGNTLEGGLDQYISMVQEKEVAGPSVRNPEFPNMVCSSELAAYWAFPSLPHDELRRPLVRSGRVMGASKVFVITGAASGIGKHLSRALAEQGNRVLATDVNEKGLADLGSVRGSGRLVPHALDVTRSDAWEKALDAAEKELGALDVVMNVAGYLKPGFIHEVDDRAIELHLDVNVKGVSSARGRRRAGWSRGGAGTS
jgi:hypothetical protein